MKYSVDLSKTKRRSKCYIHAKNHNGRSIGVKQDLHLCFIDYTEAFDTLKQEEVEMLNRIVIDWEGIQPIKNSFWKQIAALTIENETDAFF